MVGGQGSSPALLSPVVQTVLGMGFQAALVESLVETRYLLTGRHYTSVADLVGDILQAEEEDRLRAEQTTGGGGPSWVGVGGGEGRVGSCCHSFTYIQHTPHRRGRPRAASWS